MTLLALCEWPVSYAACATCPPIEDPDDQTVNPDRILFEQMATAMLWAWTGRVFGLCTVALRPCRTDCTGFPTPLFWGRGPISQGAAADRSRAPLWGPVLLNGQWYNVGCGVCGNDECSCPAVCSLSLPGPVAAVTEVILGSTILPDTAYRVDDGHLLVRLDGSCWPPCQNMGAPVGAADTWQVTYSRGLPVPVGGQVAAGILACELAKAACADSTCKLPQRIQTVSRQGVTVAVLDAFEDVLKGRTGIWLIDSWVASITGPPRAGRVYSPDLHPAGRRTTWP
ncbi:MAG TPA: hypothetical protein VGF32_02540 [Streptosporangiaceae bacterium]|jgi:hypothetical protein